MPVSFKYWDDCLDPDDMRLMWTDPQVRKEWTDAGEEQGKKVHLSRDPDGEAYLTHTEMLAVAAITVNRHFKSQLDPYMIAALAEIASGRRLFVDNYDQNSKETKMGMMQLTPKIVQWIGRQLGYKNYDIELQDNIDLLYWPFVNVYYGAAYAKWLFSCDDVERTEEFVVRAYKRGKKKASHKSSAPIFQRYLYLKENLLSMRQPDSFIELNFHLLENSTRAGAQLMYWDSKVSEEDMDAMWSQPEVMSEWTNSGAKRGSVLFSHDAKNRPYLSRVELKLLSPFHNSWRHFVLAAAQNGATDCGTEAVVEITISRHLSSKGVKSGALAALAEVCSMRFVHGVRSRTGLMGIDYPTATWLYRDCGHTAYTVSSVDDLYNPFASMYFGVAYLGWLSQYEGRERNHEFIIQAYLGGPDKVNVQETGPFWKKFLDALRIYEDPKKYDSACCLPNFWRL